MHRTVRKLRSRQALSRVAAVSALLREWDPLGIASVMPEDEYDAYARPIVSLVADGATSWRIAQYLTQVQVEKLEVAATPAANLKIAERVLGALDRLPR